MKVPAGLYIDDPAWPLLLSHIAYWGVTSAVGDAFGTTLVCADLANHPSYVGCPVKVLDGGAWGQPRQIAVDDRAGTLTVASAFTNAAGGVQQIVAGTRFVILSAISGGAGPTPPAPPGPGVSLWMFGECAPDMAASTVTIRCPNLAGLGDDLFNTEFYMQVLHNDDVPGAAPETEVRQITDYVSADGEFTVNAFTANVEADDKVCIFHETIWVGHLLIQDIFDLVNAILVTTETGGTVTLDGTEQTVYVNALPAGVFEPLKVQISLANLTAAETVRIRTYYRIFPGTAANFATEKEKKDGLTFAGVQDPALINVELEPNRYGVEVTIQRLAGGAVGCRWAAFYRN